MTPERYNWIKQNVAQLIIPLAVVIGSGLVSWGVIKATVAQYDKDIAAIKVQINDLTIKVDKHHTNADTAKHIDDRQWQMLRDEMQGIKADIQETNSLLRVHMRRTGS